MFIEEYYMNKFNEQIKIQEAEFIRNVEEFAIKTKERLTKKPAKKPKKPKKR